MDEDLAKDRARPGPAPEPAHRDDIKLERSPQRCPFCHADVAVDAQDQVVCRVCLARHHVECWGEGSRCAACGAREALGTESAAPPRVARAVGVLLGALTLLVLVGGAAWSLAAGWRPRSFAPMDLSGPPEEVTARLRIQAEAGDPAAQNLLGFRLCSGVGCQQDYAEAYRWGLLAAEAGHGNAMFGIAMLLQSGQGMPRDEAAAASWLRRSVATGDPNAGPALEALLRRRPDLR